MSDETPPEDDDSEKVGRSSFEVPWYVRLGPADMATLRRSARERWGVPDPLRSLALLRLAEVIGRAGDARETIAAARTLAAFDRVDQADERLAFDRERFEASRAQPEGTITLAELVAEAEAAAIRAREADDADGRRDAAGREAPGRVP